MYEPYKSLVDLIFDLLEEDLIKIRIFFRQNKYIPKYLNRQQMNEEYSMLYYQFIKHAFGFIYHRVKGQVIEPSVINIDKWHGQQEYDPTAECITLY